MLMRLKRNENPLKAFCENRIKKDRNVIILVDGETGTGKTLSTFSIALEIDKNFNKDFITQDANNILSIVKKIGKAQKKDPNAHKGQILVYEETQEDMLRTNANTLESKAMVKLCGKFRFLNNILIMTTPISGHLTDKLLDYVDVLIHTEKIYYKRKYCRLKVKFGRYVESAQKRFWEFMRIQYENGRLFQFKYYDAALPPKALIDHYSGLKSDFFIDSIERDEKRINNKYKIKKDNKKYPNTCRLCGYEWLSRKENPLNCPRCSGKLYSKKKNTTPRK